MGDDVTGDWDDAKIVSMVDNTITQGGALDTQYHNGNTMLHMCAHIGNADKVQQLLSAGCNPLVRNNAGRTAKDLVLETGNQRILQTLLRTEAFGRHALSRQRSVIHEEGGDNSSPPDLTCESSIDEQPPSDSTISWSLDASNMFENYLDWTEEQRNFQLQRLVQHLEEQQLGLQAELTKLGDYRMQVKEHMAELHAFLRRREHQICCDVFRAVEEEKQLRKELDRATERVGDTKRTLDDACKKTWWRGVVLLREGLLRLQYNPIWLKLTGDKLLLFEVRKGGRAARPFLEFDLDNIIRVEEDNLAQRGRKKDLRHMTFYVAKEETWLTGNKEKIQICFPAHERSQHLPPRKNKRTTVREDSYESLCAAMRDTLRGRCGVIDSQPTLQRIDEKQPHQESPRSEAVCISSSYEDSPNVSSPTTTIETSIGASAQSPVDGISSAGASPHWTRSNEQTAMDDSSQSADSLIFDLDDSKQSFCSSSRGSVIDGAQSSQDLDSPRQRPSEDSDDDGATQADSSLGMLSVSVGEDPRFAKSYEAFSLPNENSSMPPQDRPHGRHSDPQLLHFLRPLDLEMSIARVRLDSSTTDARALRKSVSAGGLLPVRSRTSTARLSEGDTRTQEIETQPPQEPPLPPTRHVPTLRARLQEARSNRTMTERKLLEHITSREGMMECLHYLQSLRLILEDPPNRPTRDLAMTSIPHLMEHIRQSSHSWDKADRQISQTDLPAYAAVSNRVKLGQPPAALRNEYMRVWLALETMWNIEQQGFETVERLSQTLVLREDTRRRLHRQQQQADNIPAAAPSELYEITL